MSKKTNRFIGSKRSAIAAALIGLCSIGTAQAQALVETFAHNASIVIRDSSTSAFIDVSLTDHCDPYSNVRPVMAFFHIGLSPGVYYASASYPIASSAWVSPTGQLLYFPSPINHRWTGLGLSTTTTYYVSAQVLYENGQLVNEREISRKYSRWGGTTTTTCLN
jgi:hypothetical protein